MAGIDAYAKRYHPFIVSGLLLTVAYFQSSGIASLIAEQLHGSSATRAGSPEDSLSKLKQNRLGTKSKNGTEILSRNAFDSITGPLVGKPPPPAGSAPVAKREPGKNEPPKCQTGEVTLIAGAIDPKYSFAVITANNESKMRRVGDEVDGKKVESILGETVVLAANSGDRCRLTMHDEQKPGATAAAEPAVTRPGEGDEPARMPTSPRLGAAAGIRKVSETQYIIEENGPQKLTQMKQAFMKSAKVVDGQGLRLYRSAQTTILGHLGLHKGDIVKTLNGYDMSSLDQSTQAYEHLAAASNVQVVVEREGTPITLDYKIEK